MRPLRRAFPGVLALVASLACASAPAPLEVDPQPGALPWTHAEPDDAPDAFRFVLIGDRTGGHRPGVYARAIEAANLLRPAFVVSVGDLIEGNTTDEARLDAEWDEFASLVEPLAAPFFFVPGNHDYGNPVMARTWTRRFGPSFYRFRYRDVLFLVLNSELFTSFNAPGGAVGGAQTQDEQLRFVERVLAEETDARWTFVLMHQPLWEVRTAREDWARVERWLGERDYTVVAGHFHKYEKQARRGREHLILGTAGGHSRLRGLQRGEFDHVTLVTMDASGPTIANLLLDGVHDVDVHDTAMRQRMNELDRVVRSEPLTLDGETLAPATQRFALENGSEVPVRVQVDFVASPDFALAPEHIDRTLAPKARESLEVALVPRASAPLARTRPARARWILESEGARGPLVLETGSWVVPERIHPIPRAEAPIEADGDLGEWGALRFAMESWPDAMGEAGEASLRFDLRADEDFLYFAFDVSDATPHGDAERGVLAQDGVTFELDARPDPARSKNLRPPQAKADGTLTSQLVLTLAPVSGRPDTTLHRFSAKLPAAARRAVRAHEGGYRAELALPADFLDERAGGRWSHLRLNVLLHDAVGPEGPVREFLWRPSRYGEPIQAIEGAGTFVRD